MTSFKTLSIAATLAAVSAVPVHADEVRKDASTTGNALLGVSLENTRFIECSQPLGTLSLSHTFDWSCQEQGLIYDGAQTINTVLPRRNAGQAMSYRY